MAATAPSPADGGPVVAPTMLQIDPSENVGPATSKSITFEQPVELTGSKKKIVDMLNPKLHNYSDPWSLSVWIIASSFVLFWIIFILTSTICPSVHTGLVVADGTEHKKKKWGTEWCDGFTPQELCGQYGEGSGYCTMCPGHHSERYYLYGAYYKEQLCPSGGEAFALSLAWTTYIEVIATFFFLWWFVKTGKVKPLNKDATLFSTASAANQSNKEIDQLRAEVVELKKRVG